MKNHQKILLLLGIAGWISALFLSACSTDTNSAATDEQSQVAIPASSQETTELPGSNIDDGAADVS